MALRAAKEQAKARGAAVQQKKQARRGGLRSGARADGRDPLPLGAAINRLITERGWEAPAAVGGVMGRWPQIVGEDLAKHCVPLRYDEDPDERVLTVQCDSTAWATQLRLLAPGWWPGSTRTSGTGRCATSACSGPAARAAATARCGRPAAPAPATPTADGPARTGPGGSAPAGAGAGRAAAVARALVPARRAGPRPAARGVRRGARRRWKERFRRWSRRLRVVDKPKR